jgi:hypothetical protein
MNTNQFRIFIPDSRFRFTTNRIMYTLLVVFALLTSLVGEKSEAPSMLLGITIFAIFVLFIASIFRKQKLHGKLTGILELKDDSIIIDNNIILMDNIEQIDFQLSDYMGRRERIGRYDLNLNPRISRGVKNNCEIKTIDGNLQRINFQIIHDSDFPQNRKTIIQYHKAGKITFKRLSQILYACSYAEIQELKSEVLRV